MGKTCAFGATLSAVLTTLCGVAIADPFPASMTTLGRTSQPIGHHVLCRTSPVECVRNDPASTAQNDDPRTLALLRAVNASVNAAIAPADDMVVHGVKEHWSFPEALGDCEDYALLKRRALVARGIHPSNLLMTVVRKRTGAREGHAVLTVRTTGGDLVLDNLEPDVLVWHETAYDYLKRQDADHPGRWVDLLDGRAQVAVAAVR